MTWLDIAPSALIYAALVILPGAGMGRLIGLRRTALWGAAPALSLSVLGVGAIFASAVSQTHTLMTVAVEIVSGLFFALMVGQMLAAARIGTVPVRPPIPSLLAHYAAFIGMMIGAVLVAIPALTGMGAPDEIVDSPDASFHTGRIRTMMDTGDASSLHSELNPRFYPSAFHVIAVAARHFGATSDPIVAANLVSLTAACVIWPVGCVALTRQVLGWRPLTFVISGIACATFPAYPTILMGWGVLWPNVLGTALLPGITAAFVAAIQHSARSGQQRGAALSVALLAVPGLFLAHPNAVASLAVFAGCALLTWLIQVTTDRHRAATTRRRAAIALAAIVAGLAAVILLLPTLSPALTATANYTWKDRVSLLDGLSEVTLFSLQWSPLWGLVLLAVLGAIRLIRLRRGVWIITAFLASVVLFLICASVNIPALRVLTGYWYNDKMRLAAMAIVPAVVLVSAGALTVHDGAVRLLARRVSPAQLRPVANVLTVLAVVAMTAGAAWSARTHLMTVYYHPNLPQAQIVSREQVTELLTLEKQVPSDVQIIAAPENGSAFLYAMTGHPMLIDSFSIQPDADQKLIGTRLPEVATDPAVCQALTRRNAWYVIHGDHRYWGAHDEQTGPLYRVPTSEGFTEVARTAHYTLYRVTACS